MGLNRRLLPDSNSHDRVSGASSAPLTLTTHCAVSTACIIKSSVAIVNQLKYCLPI